MVKKLPSLSKAESNSLYRTLKFVHDIFIKKKITYWIAFGTLLGAVRHGGPIFIDDDLDACIMKHDIPKLRKLIPYFKRHGYILMENKDEPEKDVCKKFKDSCDWYIIQDKNKDALGMDLFVMKTKGNRINYSNPYWIDSSDGKNCYYEKSLTFPLVPMRFGNYYVYVPNNSVEHLNRCYGNDWNTTIRAQFNHRLGEWIESKPRKLKWKEFKAPKPPSDTCDPIPPKILCEKVKRVTTKK